VGVNRWKAFDGACGFFVDRERLGATQLALRADEAARCRTEVQFSDRGLATIS